MYHIVNKKIIIMKIHTCLLSLIFRMSIGPLCIAMLSPFFFKFASLMTRGTPFLFVLRVPVAPVFSCLKIDCDRLQSKNIGCTTTFSKTMT